MELIGDEVYTKNLYYLLRRSFNLLELKCNLRERNNEKNKYNIKWDNDYFNFIYNFWNVLE